MDSLTADLAIQDVLGRADFVGGFDNEALDFSQLEAFINSENTQGNASYFGESLNTTSNAASGKLLNVIVENKRAPGHPLPDSPPDSSSEHPYSPSESCEPSINTSENIYTSLGQPVYKSNLLNPILSDNLILGSHIVVTDQTSEAQLLENGATILQDGSGLLTSRLLQDNNVHHSDPNLLHERILLTDSSVPAEHGRQILLHSGTDSEQSYAERPLLIENCPSRTESRRNDDLILIKNGTEYDKSQLLHIGFNSNMDIQMPSQRPTGIENSTICENGIEDMQTAVYTNLQNVSKKRKLSQDVAHVKSEPENCSPSQLSPPGANTLSSVATGDDDFAGSEGCLSEPQYQCIRFQPFQQSSWHVLCNQNLTELPVPHYRVDADKGFNFSNADDAFVCQKKNHFQVTCHIQLLGDAQFVKTNEGFQKISSFHLHFYGVKYDCPTQTIRVEQSQSDRSKKPFHPVLVELVHTQVTKITVGRLHFSETTSNNMRKKGKPNPEQRYFQLVVGLHAHTSHGNFPVVSHASQKIIVRASNPGQFENDVELCWQKGLTQDSIFHAGKVGINTDRPDESLVVHGNLKITGHIVQPSDIRAKRNIVECDTAQQLKNVQQLRVVRYEYEPTFASRLNRNVECFDTGVIAQEVAKVLPEAVSPAGNIVLESGLSVDNFLVVNKERIFMENIGAVKELCKVTDNLETRIDQLEKINKRLSKIKRGDSFKSNSTVSSKQIPHKCLGNRHECRKEDELCTNKFIQIIIVVLVLIMAFCLAAITTLYLMEAARHSQITQASLQSTHRSFSTKAPSSKMVKSKTWPPLYNQDSSEITFKEPALRNNHELPYKHGSDISPYIIGKPPFCLTSNAKLDDTNSLCQIYCCVTSPLPKSEELESIIYGDRIQRQVLHNHTKGSVLLNVDKNKIMKPFHSNNIDKHNRQKRDSDDWNEQDNTYAPTDERLFTITIQGKSFNVTLNQKYSLHANNRYNFSYSVPISKYMADTHINLIFRSLHTNLKDIDRCYNDHKQHECPYTGSHHYNDNRKEASIYKVDENIPHPQISPQSIIFEVDMLGFQSKIMTYRAALRQSVNICKLSPTKLGLEFTEYNFHFYRTCDE